MFHVQLSLSLGWREVVKMWPGHALPSGRSCLGVSVVGGLGAMWSFFLGMVVIARWSPYSCHEGWRRLSPSAEVFTLGHLSSHMEKKKKGKNTKKKFNILCCKATAVWTRCIKNLGIRLLLGLVSFLGEQSRQEPVSLLVFCFYDVLLMWCSHPQATSFASFNAFY